MIAKSKKPLLSPEEYLAWKEKQPIKYEYSNGEVFAMTGGSLPHNSIALNLASALKNPLRGKDGFPQESTLAEAGAGMTLDFISGFLNTDLVSSPETCLCA